jgi:hypothetical protein
LESHIPGGIVVEVNIPFADVNRAISTSFTFLRDPELINV